MNHIIAGYLIIEPAALPSWKTDKRLPEKLITASDCLCSIHPGNWGVSWASQEKVVQDIKKRAGISDAELKRIQAEVDDLLNRVEYGFPNVFMSVERAFEFKERYLKKIETQIIRLSLPETYFEEALEKLKPQEELMETGFFARLKRREPETNEGDFLGYEVLCWDTSSFHSFICNGLEKDYEEKLGLSLNSHGFFDDLESAKKATEYTRGDGVGAEPGYWAPFKLAKEAAAPSLIKL
jgi:hypothetical protein